MNWEDLLKAGSFAAARENGAGAARRQRVHRAGRRRDSVPPLGLGDRLPVHAFARRTTRILLALLLGLAAAGANLAGRAADVAPAMVAALPEIFHRAGRGIHAGDGDARNDSGVGEAARRCLVAIFQRAPTRCSCSSSPDISWCIFSSTRVAPHFHFGEETHHEEMSHAHASYAALLGLVIHTFFDGVAIASGLLVSTWLGGVIFVAIFLHKIPGGIYGGVADAGERAEPARGVRFVGDLWAATTLAGMGLMFLLRSHGGGCAAAFGGRDAVRGRVGLDSRSESRAGTLAWRCWFSSAWR